MRLIKPQSDGIAASLRRVRLVAQHTMREGLRLKLALLLALAGAVLILAALALREFNFGTAELRFIADFGLGAIGLFGTLLAALATAQLFFNATAEGTAGCVLSRPVRRWEYVGGQFAAMAGLLAIFTASLGCVLAGLLTWRGAQLGTAPPSLSVMACAGAVLWLKATLVAAMTLLFCSYAGSALFASGAGLLLATVAQLRPFAPGAGGLAWLRVWPNLALFDAGPLLASAQPPAGGVLLSLAAYWAAYVVLFNGLAAYAFKHREF